MEEAKIRFKFIRIREYRYLSHLDVVRQMMMALNRAGIDVKYSQGFNPNIKINFSYPVPVGLASFAEYGDLTIMDRMHPDEFISRLNSCLNPCFCVKQAKIIDKKTPSLMQDISVIEYVFKLGDLASADKGFKKRLTEGFAQRSLYSQSFKGAQNVDIVLLTLFGYTKSANEMISFKFNDFLSHLKNLTYIYDFRLINYYKKEAYVFRGDSLTVPTGL